MHARIRTLARTRLPNLRNKITTQTTRRNGSNPGIRDSPHSIGEGKNRNMCVNEAEKETKNDPFFKWTRPLPQFFYVFVVVAIMDIAGEMFWIATSGITRCGTLWSAVVVLLSASTVLAAMSRR